MTVITQPQAPIPSEPVTLPHQAVPSAPAPLPQQPAAGPAWMTLIKNTPQFKADAELASAYATALTSNAQTLPIPADSQFGRWRQHLDALLAGDDFKQWANDNHIDLAKPIRIILSRDSSPSAIIAGLKPEPSTGVDANAANNPRPNIEVFGLDFSGSPMLPASWPLIMQAASTLAAGGLSVLVPAPGRASPSTHAERPAQLGDVAAFYGEQIPHTQEGLERRANELKHANTFPMPDASLSVERLELRSELTLEQQQRKLGDLQNNSLLSQRLSALVTQPRNATDTNRDPQFVHLDPTPERVAENQNNAIAAALESTQLKIDPASWYFQDTQLAPDASVSLKQFITDQGWSVPETKDDINNLIKSIQRGPLPSIPYGNLTGAVGWTAPLGLDEKKQLYSHVRFNNLKLPGLDAANEANREGGAFTYLTKNRYWTSSELNAPRQVVEDILSSPKAKELESALQRKMGFVENTGSSDLVLGAILLGLDSPTVVDPSKRNKFAGFDLAAPRFHGKPLHSIKQGLMDHLAESRLSPRTLAPVAAYMLLSSAAPELLVKGIPADVTYGSPAWFSLKATVGFIEAKSPGSSSLMSFADVVKYAAIEPVTAQDQALLSAAKLDTLIDWALVHGVLAPSPTGHYSTEQLDTAQHTFFAIMSTLQKTPGDLMAPIPLQKEIALEALGKRFKNIPFERAVITNPEARLNNALNDPLLPVNTGPYSLLDLYLSEHVPITQGRNDWYSLSENEVPKVAVGLLDHLPPIKEVHRRAVAEHLQGRENGFVNLTKHLIAQLPIEDRKQLEYGKLDVFLEGTVIKHRVNVKNHSLNLDQSTPEQALNTRSLIIRSTHEGSVKFYEVSPQQNYLKPREDLNQNFKTGPQGQWIKQTSPYPSAEMHTNTAITEFSIPAGDSAQLEARAPTGSAAPASYTSTRSQFLGELLSKHTLGTVDVDARVRATSHTTRFDDEDQDREADKELLLGLIPRANMVRNVINGEWTAVAGEVIFDGVMYATTAGLGKAANAIKSSSGALKHTAKPFGKRLFERTASPSSTGLTDNFIKLKPEKAARRDLSTFASRSDIAEGTYKKGVAQFSTPARLDTATGKWFAVDPRTHKAYGKPLENFNPQGASLPGPRNGAMSPQQRALDIGLGRDNVIQMGGPMTDLKLIGEEIHTFTDTYKGTNRLNVVAHGIERDWVDKLTGNGTKVYVDGTLHDAPSLVNLLRSKGVDPATFDNVRLLVCHSGEGRSRAFGRLFQQEIGKPVKAFEGTVSLTHGSTGMTNLRNTVRTEVARQYPSASQQVVEQSAEILVQQRFINKVTPYIVKGHGQTIRVNMAGVGQPDHFQTSRISYLPRQFNR